MNTKERLIDARNAPRRLGVMIRHGFSIHKAVLILVTLLVLFPSHQDAIARWRAMSRRCLYKHCIYVYNVIKAIMGPLA